MMSYHYNRQKKRKTIFYFSFGVLIFLALFTPFYSFMYDVLEKPFSVAYTNTNDLKEKSKNIFHTWYSKSRLVQENEDLKKRISILEVDNLRLIYLESLLEKDRNILDLDSNGVIVDVLAKNNSGTLTISAGQNKSLKINDRVINYDGVLIGKISEVFDITSRVSLFTKNKETTNAILFPQDISIEIFGNGNAMVARLNRDIDVSVGDLVYSQDTSGYPIGKVSMVNFDPRDPSKTIFISPIHGIQNLQYVSVIIKTLTE